MSFTLYLEFEGLLHYVPNENINMQVRLCVVLPKAVGHTGKISAGKTTELVDADLDGVALDGQRAFIQFTPATADFEFEDAVVGGPRPLKGTLPLEGIIGSSADKNPAIVAPAPPSTVRAQFLIGGGSTFVLNPSTRPPQLELPANSLNSRKATTVDFAETFVMVVPNVESASLIILPLSDSVTPRATYKIATTGATADLTLSHTCFATGPERQIDDPDEDFRFHYLMLAALPNGFTKPKDMPKPIIKRFSKKIIKPDGCDCAGTRGLARPYDLDKFMK